MVVSAKHCSIVEGKGALLGERSVGRELLLGKVKVKVVGLIVVVVRLVVVVGLVVVEGKESTPPCIAQVWCHIVSRKAWEAESAMMIDGDRRERLSLSSLEVTELDLCNIRFPPDLYIGGCEGGKWGLCEMAAWRALLFFSRSPSIALLSQPAYNR